jgi:hypothetical protein
MIRINPVRFRSCRRSARKGGGKVQPSRNGERPHERQLGRPVNRSLLLAGFLFVSLCAVTAVAAEPSSELIEQGLELRRDGKPEQALELFRRAHAIAPSPRTFGQMGLVEASLKRWVDGESHLSVSLSNPDDSWVIKNRAFLDEALAQCRQHVGELVVSGPPGVEVLVGGRIAGTLPAVPTLRLAEGTVSVSATSPGFTSFETTVTIRPGIREPLAIVLTRVPSAAPPPAAPSGATAISASPPPATPAAQSSTGRGWHSWTGISLAAIGAAAIGWGVTWIVVDGGKACATSTGCSDVYNTRTWGWVLAGAGAAAVAGGAAIFFTGHQTGGPDVSVGLTPGSVLLQGRF